MNFPTLFAVSNKMKKSSLGRRSSTAHPQRMVHSEFDNTRRERVTGIPVRSRTSSVDRNMSLSTSTLVRSRSITNLRQEIPGSSNERRLTYGSDRPSRATGMSTGSTRASSYGGTKSKRDHRPLQDKEWQISAIREIEEVVRSIPGNSFKNSIKPLTINTFVALTNLLLSNLDKSINITSANYMGEIPFFAKIMFYRGNVDKSWLKSVNTPHSFTHALGFLHFLAASYQGQSQVEEDPMSLMYPENFCVSAQSTWNFKILLPYLHQSYELHYQNDPDYQQRQLELDKYTLRLHFKDEETLDLQLRELEAENNKLAEVIHRERSINENIFKEVDELRTAYDKLVFDYNKKEEHIAIVEDEIKKIENDLRTIDLNQETINKKLEEKQKIINELQEAKENQLVTYVDIENMRKQCISLQRDIEFQAKSIQEYEGQFFQEDLSVVSLQKELQSNMKKYTLLLEDALDESSLENAKIPENVQDLKIDDIKKACSVLDTIKEGYNVDQLDTIAQESNNTIEVLKREKAKFQLDCDNVEERCNLLREEINNKHQEHKKKLLELNKDLEDIEEKQLRIVQNMPESCEDLARRQAIKVEEMEAELQEFDRQTKIILSKRAKLFEEHRQEMNELFAYAVESLKEK